MRPVQLIPGIAIAFLITAVAFNAHYHDDSFWHDNFREHGAYGKLGEDNTTQVYNGLKQYLDHDLYGVDRTHFLSGFSEAEKSHLEDVKFLLDTMKLLAYLAIGAVAASLFYFDKEEMFDALFIGGMTSSIIIIVMGLAALLSFETFWTFLHELMFPQGNWVFPYDSTLGVLFLHGNFFQEFAARFFMTTIVIGGFCSWIGHSKK